MSERTYLFSYRFGGDAYSLEVEAETPEEARRRVAAMAQADFDGEVMLSVGVPLPRRWWPVVVGASIAAAIMALLTSSVWP